MSVNYSKLHNADVPVSDTEEGDGDLFGMPSQETQQYEDPLDYLDYEFPVQDNPQSPFAAMSSRWNKLAASLNQRYEQVSFNLKNSWHSINNDSHDLSLNNGQGVSSRALSKKTNGPQNLDSQDIELDEFSQLGNNGKFDEYLKESSNRRKKIQFVVCIIGLSFFINLGFIFYNYSQKAYPPTGSFTLSNSTHKFFPTTILISLDGFHPHYINSKLTPTLHSMLLYDYGAPYMIPSFPSSTFPNHWTLVTGLYPADHGIVGNTFYDPKLHKQFINTDPEKGLDPRFWQGGEPLWETAKKNNVKSAIHMWPGSEVPGVGIGNGPLFVDRYNGSELLQTKASRILEWIDIESEFDRPQLILSYVPTIDSFGHKYGISGKELESALTYVDDYLDLLFTELKARHLENIVNVVVVSDHGMAPTSNDRLLYLDDIINLDKIEHVDGWPLFGLRPSPDYPVKNLKQDLESKILQSNLDKHYSVYLTEELPPEWNFGGQPNDHEFNYRLAPIWVIPQVGYSITTHKQMKDNDYDYKPKGVHGYNNTELLMRAIFLAKGPYFEKCLKEGQQRLKPFQNTEVYNFICKSLGMKPAKNNCSIDIMSENNLLPDNWTDDLIYPDASLDIGNEFIKDSTYDLLFKKPSKDKPSTIYHSTNNNPQASLSKQSNLATVSEHIPKPTDLTYEHMTTVESLAVSSETSTYTSTAHHKWNWFNWGENSLEDIYDEVEDYVENVSDFVDSLFDSDHD